MTDKKSKKIEFNCDFCGEKSYDHPSSYNKRDRHFCDNECYLSYRRSPKDTVVIRIEESIEANPIAEPKKITREEFLEYLRKKYNDKVVSEQIKAFGPASIIVSTYGKSLSDNELISHHAREIERNAEETRKRRNRFKCGQLVGNVNAAPEKEIDIESLLWKK